MGKRQGKYHSERIAGMSFKEEDYDRIQEACKQHNLTQAEVVRGCVSIGLLAYEGRLGERIRRAASDGSVSAQTIVREAVDEGLTQYLIRCRCDEVDREIVRVKDDLQEKEAELNDQERALLFAINRHTALKEEVEEEEIEFSLMEELIGHDEDYEFIQTQVSEYRSSSLKEIEEIMIGYLERAKAQD